ncbi:BTAD domain-containing putative transcriptional regulator [Kitasatospora sp. NPDC048365]|uniref:AfsR/SARP family transcriptional regulator n=1 Tax=Kitasatospora sp. NPDC048365 TaxID=3364050 RepID=UPI00371E5571
MHYGILGTTTAHSDDGTPVPLGGARLRALLAALVLRQGRPVPAELLVDEVWDAEPPQDAAAALQTLVGRLRRTVGRAEVGSGPAGYWLTDGRTDVGEFQRLAAEGRTALEAGEPGTALERLDAALALWRGPALADLPDRHGPAARLEAQRDDARRCRITALLALGRTGVATAELAELCEQHPLDESWQVLLIRALRDGGRTAEALQRYEGVRRALAEELGTDPGAELQALYRELLNPPVGPARQYGTAGTGGFGGGSGATWPAAAPGDRDASARGAAGGVGGAPGTGRGPDAGGVRSGAEAPFGTPGTPGTSGTYAAAGFAGPGGGGGHDGAPAGLAGSNGAGARPPAGEVLRAAGNLRPRLTSFVGRDGDLATVGAALDAGRLTTLTGPGGSGKTRLSLEAGRIAQTGADWPDGVWQVELAPLEDPAAVPGAVVSALGLRDTVLHTGGAVGEAMDSRDDPLRRLLDHCGRRRMLLLLDNCEHLVQAAADLADRLLAECPGLTVLATSREPLGVPGEAVLPVEPLPDPAALRLLAERGAAARPGFAIADDPEACAEICRRLDGLPLAIELAAARLRGLTPRLLADRLDSRFALLTAGSRTLLPRQQTLRAVVDWSWDLLGSRERAVLRRLAVFAGGCTLEDAEQVVADGSEVTRGQVADLLLSLVDKSLLVADLGGEPRYGMLETIHEYATERLAEADEPEVALRHVRHYRELVRQAELDLHGPGQLTELARLEREQDNIRAALRRAVELGEEQEALVLALAMSSYWTLRDYRTEARAWYDAVSALGPDPYAEDAPMPVPLTEGPLDAPLPMAPEMLEEARRHLGLQRLVSMFTGNMATLGDPEALRTADRILQMYTPDLPQSYRSPVLLRMFALFLAGEMGRMREAVDDAVVGARLYGREGDLAFALQLRSRLLNDWVGELGQAVEDSAEALELFTRAGDRWGQSETLAAQAENFAKLGDGQRAADNYRRAIVLATELGALQEVPLLRVRLGETLMEFDHKVGERMVVDALAEISVSGHSSDGARMYGRLVLCHHYIQRGEYARGLGQLDLLGEEQHTLGPVAPEVFLGVVDCIRGWALARSGRVREGLAQLASGRRRMRDVQGGATVFAEHMSLMLLTPAAAVLAELAARLDEPRAARRAAVLLGAHDALHGHLGSYMERSEREYCERLARERVGPAEYEAAYEEGGRLELSEAAALLDGIADY